MIDLTNAGNDAFSDPTAEAAIRHVSYTREEIRAFLGDFQRYAQGCRPPKREEVLVQRAAPADEMPGSSTSRRRSDIERALQAVPFTWAQITFMALAIGETDWRFLRERQSAKHRDRDLSWRERVGDWWGLTPGEVSKVCEDTVEAMYRWLNGDADMLERR